MHGLIKRLLGEAVCPSSLPHIGGQPLEHRGQILLLWQLRSDSSSGKLNPRCRQRVIDERIWVASCENPLLASAFKLRDCSQQVLRVYWLAEQLEVVTRFVRGLQ